MKKKYKICIHAGHNPSGKIACGASDYLDESTEDRYVTRKVGKLLKKKGFAVTNCTVNNGRSQNDVLRKICDKSNAANPDITISFHFNSAQHESKSNGKTLGTEVWLTANKGVKGAMAKDICAAIAKCGFVNRGVKVTDSLYFLNHTKNPAILVEVCFVSDKDDAILYKKKRDKICENIANAIAKQFK